MTVAARSDLVCRLALEAGFDRVGIAPAGPLPHADYFHEWLDRGRAGQMDYLYRYRRLRTDPRRLLDGARSVIVVAHSYRHAPARESPGRPAGGCSSPRSSDSARGRIAQYAWGRDYHQVMRKKLRLVADALHKRIGEPFETRICVDTAPLLERELAAAAGIGWIGKNAMVLNRELGSFFFLGEIVTTLELTASVPATDHCGSCTRCLEACPTGALIAPYRMDASACISYLTIEHRGEIPPALRPRMDGWVFGCDVCQEVCPYNKRAATTNETAYELSPDNPLPPRPLLAELMTWTEHQYRRHLTGSAMKRATLDMLHRNARIGHQNRRRR